LSFCKPFPLAEYAFKLTWNARKKPEKLHTTQQLKSVKKAHNCEGRYKRELKALLGYQWDLTARAHFMHLACSKSAASHSIPSDFISSCFSKHADATKLAENWR
jgi:hypothetical protein